MQYIVQPVLMNNLNRPARVGGKVYTLSSLNSNLTLAVRASDNWVIQTAWKDSDNQLWRFEDLGDGTYKVVDITTGLVLARCPDVQRRFPDGYKSAVMVRPWTGVDDQRWYLENHGGSVFALKVKGKGTYVNVPYGTSNDGQELFTQFWDNKAKMKYRLAEAVPNRLDQSLSAAVTLYEHGGYGGVSLDVGPGSYKSAQIQIGGVSSIRVPRGLRVTLHRSETFDGDRRSFDADTDYVGDDWNDQAVAVVVEPVVTVYDQPDFQGNAQALPMGTHDMDALTIGNDAIRSVRIPLGMMVELYSDAGFKGEAVIVSTDAADLGSFSAQASSAIVKIVGTAMPDRPLRFGDRVSLTTRAGRALRLRADEVIEAAPGLDGEEAFFTIVRAGPTMNLNYVAFGDVVALQASNGKYLSQTGPTRADATSIGDGQQWMLFRAGESETRTFASLTDVVAFRRAYGTGFLTDGGTSGQSWNDWGSIEDLARIELRSREAVEGGGAFVAAVCGAQSFTVSICGADACPIAVCGAQAAIVNACGAAAVGVVICGVDVGGVNACGVLAKAVTGCGGNFCGVAACAVAACGADGCGGAACATALCGGAACGGNGCGGNACAVDACPANVCGAAACGGNACAVAGVVAACPIAACGANVCAIDMCPADLCAADACGIDLIPIIPGI